MPLRKSRLPTLAAVAARRTNALKSTGPKTFRGKARASLNALNHGEYAVHLRRKLVEAGDRQGEALYARIEARAREAFCSSTFSWVPACAGTTQIGQSATPAQSGVHGEAVVRPEDERQVRRLTGFPWCFAARRQPKGLPCPNMIIIVDPANKKRDTARHEKT